MRCRLVPYYEILMHSAYELLETRTREKNFSEASESLSREWMTYFPLPAETAFIFEADSSASRRMYCTFDDEACSVRSSSGSLAMIPAAIVVGTSVDVRSSTSTTSLTISPVIRVLPSLKPVSKALSQMLFMILGMPPEKRCANLAASGSNKFSSAHPAIRRRQRIYSPVSCGVTVLTDQLRLPRCCSWHSSGWPNT